jgi:integrase
LIKTKRNLPDVRFHDLRHTCATLLLGKGVHPKIVQEMLGHATITQTMDTYGHVLPNMQEKAVAAMEDIFE